MKCYAEKALNEVSDRCDIRLLDVKDPSYAAKLTIRRIWQWCLDG